MLLKANKYLFVFWNNNFTHNNFVSDLEKQIVENYKYLGINTHIKSDLNTHTQLVISIG